MYVLIAIFVVAQTNILIIFTLLLSDGTDIDDWFNQILVY